MTVDKREVLRYMGASHSNKILDSLITRAQGVVEAAARPRHVSRLVAAEVGDGAVLLGGTRLKSQSLAQHLRSCQSAFLFACTLGPGVDAAIKRFSITDMPLVPVLQAYSSAYIEAYADEAQQELESYAQSRSLYLRPRYSPGYGDFPLHSQRFLFAALEISKKLGVVLTDDCLMIPFKSITAIMGLSADPAQCHVHRCMTCTAQNCPFRKETSA